jgi:hypothetical protein
MAETTDILPPPTATVTLREITRETIRTICNLQVAPHQKNFVAPNAVSIAQAYFEPEIVWFRAIYADKTGVGFLMHEDDAVNESSPWMDDSQGSIEMDAPKIRAQSLPLTNIGHKRAILSLFHTIYHIRIEGDS